MMRHQHRRRTLSCDSSRCWLCGYDRAAA